MSEPIKNYVVQQGGLNEKEIELGDLGSDVFFDEVRQGSRNRTERQLMGLQYRSQPCEIRFERTNNLSRKCRPNKVRRRAVPESELSAN